MQQSRKWAPFALAAVVLVGILAAVVGCQAPGSIIDTGSVLLNLDPIQARSILPPISMEAVEFIVTATGPSGATYGPEVLTGSTVIEDLLPGTWSFTVVGRNAAHNDIGAGSGSAVVVIGQTATCSIVVAEYTGPDGSFLLDLAWEPDIIDFPVWVGTLKDSAAAVSDMAFVVDEVACTAQSLADPLHVGWYTMIVQLFDAPLGPGSEVLSTGAAAAVRIAAGRQTHGDLFLHAVQGFGMIDLQLDLDFHDPLVLSPNVPFGDAPVYAQGNHTFSVTADETCTAVYYLRGQQVATGSYTLNAGDLILDETYRLDVVAFNVDGSRAASGTWNVTSQEYTALDFTVQWIGAAGVTYAVSVWESTTHVVVYSELQQGAAGVNSRLVLLAQPGSYIVQVGGNNTIEYWRNKQTSGNADPITLPSAGLILDFGTLDFTP